MKRSATRRVLRRRATALELSADASARANARKAITRAELRATDENPPRRSAIEAELDETARAKEKRGAVALDAELAAEHERRLAASKQERDAAPAPAPTVEPVERRVVDRAHGFASLGEAIEGLIARGLGFKATEPDSAPTEPRSPIDDGPMCDTCGGWRKVRRELSPTDDGFGQAVPCPSCASYVTDTRARRFWADAGLPEDTEGLDLSTYPTTDPRQRRTLQDLRLYRERDADLGKWLFLWGPPSVGKTVLGAAITRELIAQRNSRAMFQTLGKLVDRLRAAQRGDEGPSVDDLLGELEEAPLLMLDDLGVNALGPNGQPTEFVREKLFRLVDERKNHRRLTLFTSNYDLDELERRLGERIVDRIEQQSVIVHVDGPNLRRQGTKVLPMQPPRPIGVRA